ncbi:hypothetical protein [Streptomyces sp. NPDC060184]|uniref:hypothetical protein n=1 Tax=Streptomyces sp. NPDC060184 TaxID=3347064 RepID=UPI003653CC85
MSARAKNLTGWAVLLAAVLVCALGGWSYAAARGDDSVSYAKSRDAALAAGRSQVARLNSMDGTEAAKIDAGLDGWLDVTAGPLHDQLKSTRAKDAAAFRKAGTSAKGTVTDAALTALDERVGTAALIATVEVKVTPRTGAAGTERKRFEAALERTADGWKVRALTAIPVGAAT